ncbi:MAG: hypothetical protein ACYST9_01640, partial [Planctomycetota bacterium]
GTYGYDDRSGFRRSLVDGSDTGDSGEENVWLGEAGLRVSSQYWKVYPSFKSRLWDLHQLRHVMRPHLTAVAYTENESVIKQRDILNFGLSQKWQTKRLRRGRQSGQRQYETVDWMRLNFDLTFVDDPESSQAGPDRMIWNRPFVPLSIMSAPDIFNADMGGEFTRFELYGPRRNYFSADYSWRLSDTSAVSADCYYDMLGGTVEQFNVGISRYRWPNLTYYIGSRYLRNVEVLDEKGSNAITFAATYELDPRYTLVFSQQYDFDYGHNSRSDVALIRRYHRIYCGISFSADHSLDRQAIIFSIWPQGVSELGIGPERYMGLGR